MPVHLLLFKIPSLQASAMRLISFGKSCCNKASIRGTRSQASNVNSIFSVLYCRQISQLHVLSWFGATNTIIIFLCWLTPGTGLEVMPMVVYNPLPNSKTSKPNFQIQKTPSGHHRQPTASEHPGSGDLRLQNMVSLSIPFMPSP
jgi:hypothetical protein